MLAGNGFGGLLSSDSAAAAGAERAAVPVPGGAGTGTERAVEDARKVPRCGAASHGGVLWWPGEGRGGGMLPLLPEFLWGLPRLLSTGSSWQSCPGSPRLQMKVRAAPGWGWGERLGGGLHPPSLSSVARGQQEGVPWPGSTHLQPHIPSTLGTPTPSPAAPRGSASPAVTHPLHRTPRPPPPALAQPGCSSLNSTGVFWGSPASPCPLRACRLQKCQRCLLGSPLKWCQAGEGTLLLSSHHPFCPQGG